MSKWEFIEKRGEYYFWRNNSDEQKPYYNVTKNADIGQ